MECPACAALVGKKEVVEVTWNEAYKFFKLPDECVECARQKMAHLYTSGLIREDDSVAIGFRPNFDAEDAVLTPLLAKGGDSFMRMYFRVVALYLAVYILTLEEFEGYEAYADGHREGYALGHFQGIMQQCNFLEEVDAADYLVHRYSFRPQPERFKLQVRRTRLVKDVSLPSRAVTA